MTSTLEPTDDRPEPDPRSRSDACHEPSAAGSADDRHERTAEGVETGRAGHVARAPDDPYGDRAPGPAIGGPNRHSALLVEDPELVEPRSIRWTTSPFDRRGLGLMVVAYVVMTSAAIAVGMAIVEWWDPSRFGEADADVNRAIEDLRTGWLTTVSEHMSHLSDTRTKIVLGIVLVPFLAWLFRRWHEAAFLFGGLVLEVSIFGTSARIVGRDRPPVEQLEESFTSSFPSGHIAAATTFFVGLGVVILMRTRRTGPRVVAWMLMIGCPLAVAWGRIYMGMHFVTDAVAGVTIGLVVVAVMYRVVMRTLPPDESPARHDEIVAAAKEPAAREVS